MNKREFQELKKRFGEETKKRKVNKILSTVTTFLSVLGVSVISYYFINDLNLNRVEKDNKTEITLKKIQQENINLKNEILELETQLQNRIIDTAKTTINIETERFKTLEKKIEKLESLIMDSPEKALSIPLLSKEIESQKLNNLSKIELIQDKINTVVDLNKWILGLIFSLLITIVISNLMSFYKKKNDNNDSE